MGKPKGEMALRVGRRDSDDKAKKWLAALIGVIMLSSVIGYVFLFNPSLQGGVNFRHAGLTFKQTPQGTYTLNLNGQSLDFFSRPEDVDGLNISSAVLNRIVSSKALYITYYWNSSLADEMALFQFDFAILVGARHGVYAQPAFTTSSPLGSSVADCGNATRFVPVLLLQEGVNTAIALLPSNQDCIVLNASGSANFLRMSDRLKYAALEAG